MTLDDARRTQTVERETDGGSITAVYAYDAAGRVTLVEQANGVDVRYEYDDANRLTQIRHEKASDQSRIFQLDYQYSPDGLVEHVTETDAQAQEIDTEFEYDPDVRRDNRLVFETRYDNPWYWYAYTYDQGGNRTRKEDGYGVVTEYTYDVSDPNLYDSQGNRLMYSVMYDGTPASVIEERWYTYDEIGNAEHVIRWIEGDVDGSGNQWYRGTRLIYAKNGHLWIARSERWQLDAENGNQAFQCEPLSAMEYRYDSGRRRYLVRERDPVTLLPFAASDGRWSDYDGDWIHGDYTISGSPASATDTMAHEPGLAQFDHAAGALHYLHGNLIGTTERMTDDLGAVAHRAVFTAFGEPVFEGGTVSTRYGYAGAWGYQAAEGLDPLADLGWLHVGERYYDPAAGRFAQRDPIGIRSGPNSYVYVSGTPTIAIDPSGLQDPPFSVSDWMDVTALTAAGGAGGGAVLTGTPAGAGVGAAGGAIGGFVGYPLWWEVKTFSVRLYGIACAQLQASEQERKNREQRAKHPEIWPPLPPRPPAEVRCFAAGTMVSTESGLLDIELLTTGCTVLSVLPDSYVPERTAVKAVRSSWTSELWRVSLPAETLECTGGHSFWVVGRGWVEARDLKGGDQLEPIPKPL